MIWFSCKQCSKVHGRPESSIGATIFCDCGQGIVVPWDSTAAEPPPPPAIPVEEMPPPIKLEPVAFDAAPPKPPPVRARKRPRVGARDPRFCFNHEEVPRQAACVDCGENFCLGCLVSFEGESLCGPCKNYRVRLMQKALPASGLAKLSLALALAVVPLALCLSPLGRPGFPWGAVLSLVPQAAALVLGVLALRAVETDASIGGRSLALTALLTALVTTFLTVVLMMYTPRMWT